MRPRPIHTFKARDPSFLTDDEDEDRALTRDEAEALRRSGTQLMKHADQGKHED